MIIKCFRCGKEIDTPNDDNADYVIASDMIATEKRETLVALKENAATLEAKSKGGTVKLADYTQEEITSTDMVMDAKDVFQIITLQKDKQIQKTGIVCPDCYLPTDIVIWGIHKETAVPK